VDLQLSGTSRILGIIAAAVLAGGLAACGAPSSAAHPDTARTSAAAVPVLVQPDIVGWSGMAQRPDRIYVGMGGAPVVRQLTWRNWGSPRASAEGKLDLYWPQPGPISGWHPATYPVTVRLQDIETHNGQPSYRKMADLYVNRRGVTKVLYFRFYVLPGGSAPAWSPGTHRPGSGPVQPVVDQAGVTRLTDARPGTAPRTRVRPAGGVTARG
jgi:hypothetical protein